MKHRSQSLPFVLTAKEPLEQNPCQEYSSKSTTEKREIEGWPEVMKGELASGWQPAGRGETYATHQEISMGTTECSFTVGNIEN